MGADDQALGMKNLETSKTLFWMVNDEITIAPGHFEFLNLLI